MDSELNEEIRRLASQLGPPSGVTLNLLQGVVFSVEDDTCTLVAQGSSTPTSRWRWLLQAYTPEVGQVVWVLDGGPGQKIIIGNTRSSE